MLAELRIIVQRVNSASNLLSALDITVSCVRETLKTQVCSVYLYDSDIDGYMLMASQGLKEQAVGQVSLHADEGLVGLVAKNAEPLNLDDASTHPSYFYLKETGEESFNAFLGVPIIHYRKVLGVLVVQNEEVRRFDEGEEAFLVTLSAQLAGVIAHAEATGAMAGLSPSGQKLTDTVFQGISGSPGVAIGDAVVVFPQADLSQVPERQVNDIEMEIEFFQECLKSVQQDMTALESKIGNQLAEEELQLFNVYARMLDDDVLGNEVIERIRLGSWAQGALAFVARKHIRAFEAIEDDYLRDRSADIKDLFSRVLLYLQKKKPFIPKYANNSILVSNELTPSMIADVPLSNLKGLVSIKGAGNSHIAILARAMGIPTVMGVTDLPLHLVDGKRIVLDGNKGNVISNPTELLLKDYTEAIIEQDQFIAGLEDLKDFPCETKDKHKVHLWINTGLMSDTIYSVDRCVEGVGLFRTEVPFILSERFPSEKEQTLIYRQQLESFAPNLVTMRTLDVGGDKDLPYFPIQEANPFLGWRGIRVTLDHPEIFISQIRAMLRASYKLGNLQIMLPMISNVGEVNAAIELIKRAHRELRQEGLSIKFPPIGVMIELPAAVYQARALANLVDFISVGSNDLTQYLLAVDRNNPRVASLYSAFHPAVLGSLNYIVKEVKLVRKPISICGEMAGDPGAAVLLMAMGFDILSMNSAALLKVKSVIRSITYLSARDLLDSVLKMDDMHAVRKEVDLMLYNSGVDRVLRSSRTN